MGGSRVETYVNLGLAIPLAQLQLLLGGEVLVPEEDDAALGNQESQLVTLDIRQVLELQTLDLSANVDSQVRHLGRGRQKVLLGLVCARTGIYMLPLNIPDVVHILEVERATGVVRVALAEVNTTLGEALLGPFGESKGLLLLRDKVLDGVGDGDRLLNRVNGSRSHVGCSR